MAHLMEWLNLMTRWVHIIVGVAWIGASFYFVWLENNIERERDDLPDDIAGDLWAIHGGGIYYLQRYKLAPKKIPEHLHWFKWEAYWTWITGFTLLIVVYYMNASAFMIDTAVSDLSEGAAIGIGLGALTLAWVFYDVLCRTPILKKPTLMLVVMFTFMTVMAYVLFQFLAPRAAFIHIGAMIGTMMAGNVLMVIIPNQGRLVDAANAGKKPDLWKTKLASMRSRHNNYFTLPVLFIMVSSHFPSTYGNEYGWAILAIMSALSIGVRHHFNVRHKSGRWAWTMPVMFIGLCVLAWFTSPEFSRRGVDTIDASAVGEVSLSEAKSIIATRCATCHSKSPSDDVFTVAPLGVMLDTEDEIRKHAPRIRARIYELRTMPLVNKTEITEEERAKVAAWIDQNIK